MYEKKILYNVYFPALFVWKKSTIGDKMKRKNKFMILHKTEMLKLMFDKATGTAIR